MNIDQRICRLISTHARVDSELSVNCSFTLAPTNLNAKLVEWNVSDQLLEYKIELRTQRVPIVESRLIAVDNAFQIAPHYLKSRY